ncbi:MAG: S8 family serine peptidase [Bacteroidota bacterium]
MQFRHSLLLACLVLTLSFTSHSFGQFAVPTFNGLKVNSTTVDDGSLVDITLNISNNETFTVRADVSNSGSAVSPAGYNNISVSVEQFNTNSDKQYIWSDNRSSDLSYGEFFGSDAGGGPDGYYDYVFVESNDGNGWSVSETNYLEVKIQPRAYITYEVYVRAAMSDQQSWTTGWKYNPTSGSTDCTGKYAKRIRVRVNPPISAPTPPTNLQAVVVSSSQINLSWTDNANNETGFRIERKTGSGGSYSEIDTRGANITTYQNTGLSAGTTYYYRVRAHNGGGNSGYTNEANGTTYGSIVVTIQNLNGTSTPLPGSNGQALLYDANWNYLDKQANTNPSGVATLTEVALGTYNVESYHNPSNPSTIFGPEFWGGAYPAPIDHSSGSTPITIRRHMPYSDYYKVYIAATNQDVTGGNVQVGTPLRIELKVKNPSTNARPVKARLVFDRDKVATYDFDQQSNSASVPPNGEVTFSYNYTPQNIGEYYGVIGTLTNTYSTIYVITDGWPWATSVLQKWVKVTAPDINVDPTHLTVHQPSNVANAKIALGEFAHQPEFNRDHAPAQVVVKIRASVSLTISEKSHQVRIGLSRADELFEQIGTYEIIPVYSSSSLPSSMMNTLLVRFSAPNELAYVVESLSQIPEIEWVDLNYLYRVEDDPNDPQYAQQWHLTRIHASDAWDVGTGDPNVLIGIIDTGVDWNHPDLTASVWINEDEVPGNGIDDDGNGRTDDIRGWDWVTGATDATPGEDGDNPDNDPMDFDGHGTHCAGIAAATTNNGIGVAGISRGCRIMPLRAGYRRNDGRGWIQFAAAASAIEYATANGARVVSLSFGGGTELLTPVTHAFNNNVVVVHAAGNLNSSTGSAIDGIQQTISVANTGQNDVKATDSNFGNWVDVSAPGVSIRSTLFDDTYGLKSGTSMATPLVAGLAGLILSQNSSLSSTTVSQILTSTADNIDDANPDFVGQLGSGRINALTAIHEAAGSHEFVIQNVGNVNLTVTNISDNKDWLTISPPVPPELTILPGSSETITIAVVWNQIPGTQDIATVTVASNDPDEPTMTVQVTAIKGIPPSVTQHPTNQSVDVGQTVTFSVGAMGDAPLSYQWQRGGVNISGATSSAYTTPATTMLDNGSTFQCVLTNPYGNATSNQAILTVNDPSSISTEEMPLAFYVSDNYPDPFNPVTTIAYGLPLRSPVSVDIYNVLGQHVATLVNETQEPGHYSVRWDAFDIGSAVYFCRIVAGDFIQIRKMTLVR